MDEPELCPVCEQPMSDVDVGRPVCVECDRRLDLELAAYISFIKICREPITAHPPPRSRGR
ncbi:MAG TPA: hypothetical protein VHI55_13370 [Gaiellaceae bacterium]|nr:hypothetical protein [Gaiellaceae bacterium]